MSGRVLAAIGIGVAAFAAAAVPAFTADSGALSLRVVAQEPTPCIEFATPPGGNVDFGTLTFSRTGAPSLRVPSAVPRVLNCGLYDQRLFAAGTDATSECATAGCTPFTWTLGDVASSTGPCPATNLYGLRYEPGGSGSFSISKGNQPLGGLFSPAGAGEPLWLVFYAPCRGSQGSGRAFTFTLNVTAVVA